MKCISLWQPWATLIAIGAKSIETRGWATAYSGRLAIHAAKRWTKEQDDLCFQEAFYLKLRQGWFDDRGRARLPLDAIVATCRLVECHMVKGRDPRGYGQRGVVLPPPEPERSFGDYTPGRWAWILQDVEPLAEPVPFKGAQGFFEVPDGLLAPGGAERVRRPAFPASLFPAPGGRWS